MKNGHSSSKESSLRNKPGLSRRNFLKLSAAAAAGAGMYSSSALAEGSDELKTLPVQEKPGFDHLVVLMFENRSFDNFLGYLYPPGTVPGAQTFNGVANGNYSNPSPDGSVAAHVYSGGTDMIMRSPTPDPGEEYPHVNTQLFGTRRSAGKRPC